MIALTFRFMGFCKLTYKGILFICALLLPSAALAQLCPEDRPQIGESRYSVGHWGAFVPRDKHIGYPVEKYKACIYPKTAEIPEKMIGLDKGNKILDPNDPYSPVKYPDGGEYWVYRCGKVNMVSWRSPRKGRAIKEESFYPTAFPFPKHYDPEMHKGDESRFSSLESLLGNNNDISPIYIISKNGRQFEFEAVGRKVDKSTRPWKRTYPAFEPGETWVQRTNCKEQELYAQ